MQNHDFDKNTQFRQRVLVLIVDSQLPEIKGHC